MSLDMAVAVLALGVSFFTLHRSYFGMKRIRPLRSGVPLPEQLPLVSVIIAAKEEQETIEETVQHLMRQTYPRLEIIAVNDRSNDATGARLNALKAWSEGKGRSAIPLKVIHITQLPEGWIGKNHALFQGYLQSKGSYILFTDADVRFSPDAIRDSVAYAVREQADHVALTPKLVTRSFWLRAFVHYFLFTICLYVSPWTGNDDGRRTGGMGIGAFNLLRRDAYEEIGTHRALAMRPDDDLRLGKLVKRTGLRQRIAIGTEHIRVEWYTSLKEAFLGLEKNIYSGFGYRLWLASLAAIAQSAIFVVPFLWLLWARDAVLLLLLLSAACMVGTYLIYVRLMNREPGWDALVFPVSAMMLIAVLVRSVWLTHRRSGMYWRGTFYSLDDLRRLFGDKEGNQQGK